MTQFYIKGGESVHGGIKELLAFFSNTNPFRPGQRITAKIKYAVIQKNIDLFENMTM